MNDQVTFVKDKAFKMTFTEIEIKIILNRKNRKILKFLLKAKIVTHY